MPTWRETKTSFLADTNIDFHLLNDILKKQGELLILKLHVNTSEKDTFSFLSNIVLLPAHIDVYCILPYTNTLITDYSSVLYDYILLPDKQVILYLFDLEEYLKHREFNYPFLSNVSGTLINSASDLYSAFSSDKLSTVNNVNVIRDRFWGDYDGNASKRIVEKIYTGYI
jgi:CDP-glycerol glycerophosphotransferase (TagB/SpsB family)